MMAQTLEAQANRLEARYIRAREIHRPTKRLWKKLRDARKRALKVTNRHTKAIAELPLFAGVRHA